MTISPPAHAGHSQPVDVLLLGSGWTSQFLLPLLNLEGITYAFTSRQRSTSTSAVPPPPGSSIHFELSSDGKASRSLWHSLPKAKVVLIVFPLRSREAVHNLIDGYELSHGAANWILLGSTGAWGPVGHFTSTSPIDTSNARASAEESFLALHRPEIGRNMTVLNLAGLYGADRQPANFAKKVATSQDKLRDKGSLHLIHGKDVARAIVGVFKALPERASSSSSSPRPSDAPRSSASAQKSNLLGKRWIVTDTNVYDWWFLVLTLSPPSIPHAARWVSELCAAHSISALPRAHSLGSDRTQAAPAYLERSLDGTHFWDAIGQKPEVPRCDLAQRGEAIAFQPVLDEMRLRDLRTKVDAAVDEQRVREGPSSPFEADKERFGLTYERFRSLLESWSAYLEPQATSAASESGTHPSASTSLKSAEGGSIDVPVALELAPRSVQSLNGSAHGNSKKRLGADHDTWTAQEARLKSFEHFKVHVKNVHLHFIREKPDYEEARRSGRRVIPLLLLHGWPGSFLEFLDTIKPLAHPGPSAPTDVPAFDVVVPSHTGYAWSSNAAVKSRSGSEPVQGEWSGSQGDLLVRDEATLMDALMRTLGFPYYAAQAGDWSNAVARFMAIQFPNRCKAVHLNFCPAPPPRLAPPLLSLCHLVPPPIRGIVSYFTPNSIKSLVESVAEMPRTLPRSSYAKQPGFFTVHGVAHRLAKMALGFPSLLDKDESTRLARAIEFQTTGSAYAAFHGTRPGTLAIVTESSPVALLAWIGEKFLQWTDQDPPDSEILASLTLWWCTDTMARSLYPYRNRPASGLQGVISRPENRIPCPFGYTDNPYEIMPAPKEWIRSTVDNFAWYRKHEQGGHFFAMERPAAFVEDVRDCFAEIWPIK
ncbi:alpha/beta-hydrolase [Ceraceosorus guamensis]|uniref:Alpha/beta-hydrolase n=1 Tax=Ceraceosorus guamensis TaxID=1522189 RepID=A0A316W1N1_9BASI|nr:alpha/beta-hydrolase [Ceraceosorus guamensis]PWN43642.1 alpha/beta-hydrolase [Ceraceosorus guamensis]